MTAAEIVSTNGQGMTDAEARIKAREMSQAAEAAGSPMSGAELGRAFGRTDRWGRKQIAATRSGQRPTTVPAGTHPRSEPPRRRNGQHPGNGTPSAPTGGGGPASPATGGEVPALTPGVRRITTVAVVAVALVAAIASYDHQRVQAEMAGEGWRAWMLPISVDGLVVAASMSMLARRRAGLPTGALTWLALLAGIGASLAANVAGAEPTLVGRFVAAWPPLAFAVAFEMAMRTRAVRDGGTGR